MDLLTTDISDVDKSMMCVNLATICDKKGLIDQALEWYDRGVAYEQNQNAHYVAEQRAAFLADKGRDGESLSRYGELLKDPGLTEDAKERIRRNIEILRQRTV